MEKTDNASVLSGSEEYDREWIQIIEEWKQSGLSIAEFVRNKDGITYNQFMNNRRRLFPEDIRKSDFMEKETTWSALHVEIPSSTINVYINVCRIEVQSGFDQELLREIVEVLKLAN
jgi:hypothetical protein